MITWWSKLNIFIIIIIICYEISVNDYRTQLKPVLTLMFNEKKKCFLYDAYIHIYDKRRI